MPCNKGYCPLLSTGNCPHDIFFALRDIALMTTSAENIARNILTLVRARGTTKRNLSMRATGTPDAVREIERGKMPSAERLRRIAQELKTTPEILMSEGPVNDKEAPAPKSDVALAEGLMPYVSERKARSLAVYGTALGHNLKIGDDGTMVEVEQTIVEPNNIIQYVDCPRFLEGVDTAYALYIQGDSMWPRYEQGDMVVVDPRRPPAPGEDVIVQLHGEEERSDGGPHIACALIKRLIRRSGGYVELRQFNPDTIFRIEARRVHSIHRVVPLADLLRA